MGLNSLDLRLLVQAVILTGVPLAIWCLPKVHKFFPLVILQLAVGIFVGPSVMGSLWPGFKAWLFAPDALAGLAALSFWGVVFFVFYTGLHIEKEMFFGPRATLEFWTLAFTSLLFPFAIGCLVGWLFIDVWFDDRLLGPDGTRVTYILSVGVCVGVTALPVLSAILMELGQLSSDMGILMIACATVHDVILWLLITLIFGLAGGEGNWAGVWQPLASFGLVIVLILALGFAYSPLMGRVIRTRWCQRQSVVPRLTITLVMMYFAAIGSEVLQVHTLVGVVAFGACVPLSEKSFVMGHIDILNRALFLPLFFGNSGLQVKLNQATSKTAWIFLVLLFAAFLGQIPGSLLVSRLFKRTWKQACITATFMLCKGGVGIIVATLLLQRKIINEDTFSGMMLMALASTAATKPLILLICKCFPGSNDPFSLQRAHSSASFSTQLESKPSETYSAETDQCGEAESIVLPDILTIGPAPTPNSGLPNPYSYLEPHQSPRSSDKEDIQVDCY